METIHLLTSNPGKIAAADSVFHDYNIHVESLDLSIPEIQAKTSQEIAMHAALEAYKQSGLAVVREDHSFYIDDLGMPGPFMTYIDKVISVEQLLKIIDTLPTRNGHYELAAAYVDTKGTLHEFSYQVPVIFSKEARGNEKLRWERIIQLPHETRTFAEYDESERISLWTKNYQSIAELICAGTSQ